MFGSYDASMIAIVWPAPFPVTLPKLTWFNPYALLTCAGDKPVGLELVIRGEIETVGWTTGLWTGTLAVATDCPTERSWRCSRASYRKANRRSRRDAVRMAAL